MTCCQGIEARVLSVLQQGPEFHDSVAGYVWVWGDAVPISLHHREHDVLMIKVDEIDHLEGKLQGFRNRLCIGEILRSRAFPEKILFILPSLHIGEVYLMALILQQSSRHGTVDSSRQRHQYFLLPHLCHVLNLSA